MQRKSEKPIKTVDFPDFTSHNKPETIVSQSLLTKIKDLYHRAMKKCEVLR